MFGKNNLIYVIEDNIDYGNYISSILKRNNYNNVRFFHKESEFFNNIHQFPHVVVSDYNLTDLNGLELLRRAKEIHPFFYAILLTGDFHANMNSFTDDRFIHLVDKYLVKGMNEVPELLHTLSKEVG